MTDLPQLVKQFRAYVKTMMDFQEAGELIGWDMRTGLPKKGAAQRAEVLGTISSEVFKRTVSPEMDAYLQQLSQPDNFAQLDPITQAVVKECQKEFERSRKIPPELFQQYVVLRANSESAWEEAHHDGDFDKFQPYLEQIVSFNQQFIELWGYQGNKYNTLLDYYEPGLTVEQLDPIFRQLRNAIVPLLQAVQASPSKPSEELFGKGYDVQQQRKFSEFILKQVGFDFAAGRLDVSLHPFATGINRGDVRITTRFDENDFRNSLFSTIHEFGHALYEQNISEELTGTPLRTGSSMGIHESQSRFWENVVGRSREFWEHFYPSLVEFFPEQLQGVTVSEFYRSINRVSPSFIRTEADELTYNLHIMIRYEIEKGLINGNMQVRDLPTIWNSLMQEYLGVVPPNNRLGVLQDVHWSGGDFGYFPSYTLGNLYAAQFAAALQREMPDFKETVGRGDLAPLRGWLKERIHQYGKLKSPAQLLQDVTGEQLNAAPFTDYLTKKFKEVYQL